jgi:hypothetical protein
MKIPVTGIVLTGTSSNVATSRLGNAWIRLKLQRVYISDEAISGLSFDILSNVLL